MLPRLESNKPRRHLIGCLLGRRSILPLLVIIALTAVAPMTRAQTDTPIDPATWAVNAYLRAHGVVQTADAPASDASTQGVLRYIRAHADAAGEPIADPAALGVWGYISAHQAVPVAAQPGETAANARPTLAPDWGIMAMATALLAGGVAVLRWLRKAPGQAAGRSRG